MNEKEITIVMFVKKDIFNDYEYPSFNIWSVIYKFLYYILHIPIRISTFITINYYLYYNKKIDYDVIEPQKAESIPGKIISWNIQFGNGFIKKGTLRDIIEYLKEERAEIYLFQEVMSSNDLNQVEILKEKLNMKYSVFSPSLSLPNIEVGNLILSNNKIDNITITNTFQLVETTIQDKSVIVINVHLKCDILCVTQKIELDCLLDFIQTLPSDTSIVIMGDFNLPTFSKVIKYLNTKLHQVNNNIYTYPSNYPLVKIDYLYTKNIEMTLTTPQVIHSDHLPLIALLA